MALAGFPDQIEIVIGNTWTALATVSEDETLVLNKVSGQDIWSEDGTLTPNLTTNRLALEFYHSVAATYTKGLFGVSGVPTNSTTFISTISRTSVNIGLGTTQGGDGDYIFLEAWDKAAAISLVVYRQGGGLINTPSPYMVDVGYGGVFKSMQAYSPSADTIDFGNLVAQGIIIGG